MSTVAVAGPPEHATVAAGETGVGSGEGDGEAFADGDGDAAGGVGVGSGDWAGVAAELGAGEIAAVGAAAPQATTVSPVKTKTAKRLKPILPP